MPYAFDEIWQLRGRLGTDELVTNYVCSLVAELTYYHVPEFEVEGGPHRSKLVVPSFAYSRVMSLGRATGVLNFLAERDLSRSFVAIERGAIAVGFLIGDVLLIGFRGTRFPFDWRINIRSQLIDYGPFDRWFHPRGRIFWPLGRVHRGFAEEAFRIALRVREEVAKIALKEEAKVYICGHSLGGAIAALSAPLLEDLGDLQAPRLFGSPRYADVAHYCSTRLDILPRQIKRENDLVPSVPPKKAGYADHPLEYDTSGNLRPTLQDASWASTIWRASLFLGNTFEPHFIEGYRREIGVACGATNAKSEFADFEQLTKAHVNAATAA